MYYNNYNQQIVRVNGEPGARAFQMMPNSSSLLLDQTGPYVWLVQTDGAGYKDLKCFEIKPYTPAAAPDLNEVLERLKKLEDRFNESNNTGDVSGQT